MDPQENITRESEDTFGLEFAAVQWLNLVTNAEELFNKLLHSVLLSGEEKEQIQRWLCLKQECEECVASDEATSFDGHPRHSLERIEELTEDTENTQELSEPHGKSSDSQYESDSESDFDYQHPDFEDKLDGYMECFRDKVDLLIRSKFQRNESMGGISEEKNSPQEVSLSQHFLPHNSLKGRRKSLHPGSLTFPITLSEAENKVEKFEETETNITLEKESEFKENILHLENTYHLGTMVESNKEFKDLSLKLQSKKTQFRQIIIDLEGLQKRLEELQQTVKIKEKFIKELIKNSGTRESAKIKFKKKYTKLEEEYYKIRFQIAHIEYALHEKKHNTDYEIIKGEIEKYKNLAKPYEKRLKDIDMITQMAGDSAKTVLELENSVLKSKKEIERYKEQIGKEETRKMKVEKEIQECEEKMRILEDGLQNPKHEIIQEGETSHFEMVVKSDVFDSFEDKNNVEALRKEITDLRNTKDCLLEERTILDEKYRKTKVLTTMEKRRILEYDEGIEAIDAVIEYKNEMMCGRKSLNFICVKTEDLGQKLLMGILVNLSLDETLTLLRKYFRKIIDLKESGRKMEQEIFELQHEKENQARYIQNLTQSLQTQRIEAEHQKVALQRSNEGKLHLMMRHFANESESSGTEARGHLPLAKDDELNRVKRENKHLRRKLQEMEALMQAAAATGNVMRIKSRSNSPDLIPLKRLPVMPSSSSTSKVTREKNKVIISLNALRKKGT